MKIEFPGRTVVVTGAGHGLGRAIARGFADMGARLYACDLNAEGLGETSGGRMTVRAMDIAERGAVQDFVGQAARETGRIDVLVNCAGGVRGQVGRPLETITDVDWRVIFQSNVDGAFFFSQAVAPAMKAAGKGRIVNISSGAGLGVSLTGIQAYASAKAALIGLTRQLGHELGPFGITVNSVAPGFVRSNPATERQWEAYGAEGQKRLVEAIALKRLGTPADIVNAVLFLASDQAGWISGQTLSVDGGK
ncbi:MAG: SDR family oxidoreductase [Alphaproteobacteria bacterium]|nr:SDR family oxidoreductase [Alphaproteobacteria bacterium]